MNYEFKAIETKYISATGYPGNQPPGGVYFKNGGKVFWNSSGGPEISVSIGFSNENKNRSYDIDIGKNSTVQTNYVIHIPAGKFYRVRLTRRDKVVKTAVYGSTTGPKKILYYIYPQTIVDPLSRTF